MSHIILTVVTLDMIQENKVQNVLCARRVGWAFFLQVIFLQTVCEKK